MTRFGKVQIVQGFSESSRNLVAADVRRRTPRGCAASQGRGADGSRGVGQGIFWQGNLGQGNGGKGMGTGSFFVFIPLPPFPCPKFPCKFRFGDLGSESGWLRGVRRTAGLRRTGAPSIARHGAQPGRSGRAMLGAPPANVPSSFFAPHDSASNDSEHSPSRPASVARENRMRIGTKSLEAKSWGGFYGALRTASSASSRRRLRDCMKTP